jgi:hypothetical protein
MAGRGGRRPGAGRKPKGLRLAQHLTPIQAAEGRICDKLPWLVDKLFELADGVYAEKQLANGVSLVYQQVPDRRSITYLIDRVLGKAVERQESGAPGAFTGLEDVPTPDLLKLVKKSS